MAKKKASKVRRRSSISGRTLDKAHAARWPKSSVEEKVDTVLWRGTARDGAVRGPRVIVLSPKNRKQTEISYDGNPKLPAVPVNLRRVKLVLDE